MSDDDRNYDQQCEDLARFWLNDQNVNATGIRVLFTEADVRKLANEIQHVIEDFVSRKNLPPQRKKS
jgi:hypothetical protein